MVILTEKCSKISNSCRILVALVILVALIVKILFALIVRKPAFKNLLVRNHLTYFNIIWQQCPCSEINGVWKFCIH